MLFATLDPTMRGVTLPSGRKIILSDTVGFISDLPTQLVAAFRATLEEVLEADLVLHVRDIAHPESAEQSADVAEILTAIGLPQTTPLVEVWNKLDLVEGSARDSLDSQKQNRASVFPISALTGEGIHDLLTAISGLFEPERTEQVLSLGFGDGRARAWLHAEDIVEAEEQTDEGWQITVSWTERQEKRFRAL
jgi:GTP-binding protein HflX